MCGHLFACVPLHTNARVVVDKIFFLLVLSEFYFLEKEILAYKNDVPYKKGWKISAGQALLDTKRRNLSKFCESLQFGTKKGYMREILLEKLTISVLHLVN